MKAELDDCIPNHANLLFTKPGMADALKIWATWYGASAIASSPLAIAKKLSTGKDSWTRFDVDWDQLRQTTSAQLALAKKRLKKAAGIEIPEAERLVFSGVGKASPAYDPITGTGACDRAQVTERRKCI
jgi:hypothetical protein